MSVISELTLIAPPQVVVLSRLPDEEVVRVAAYKFDVTFIKIKLRVKKVNCSLVFIFMLLLKDPLIQVFPDVKFNTN